MLPKTVIINRKDGSILTMVRDATDPCKFVATYLDGVRVIFLDMMWQAYVNSPIKKGMKSESL